MKTVSTKAYLIRAIYEWCADSGFTPYLAVKVSEHTQVPREHVKDGEIVLNIGHDATHRLTLGNEVIEFSARFNGTARQISVPISAVSGIFARENGQGMMFPKGDEDATADAALVASSTSGAPPSPLPTPEKPDPAPGAASAGAAKKSRLRIVK